MTILELINLLKRAAEKVGEDTLVTIGDEGDDEVSEEIKMVKVHTELGAEDDVSLVKLICDR